MSEDVARRELEDLLARDVSDGDPMVAWALQDKHSIRVGVRGGAPGVGKSRALFREWQHLDDCRKLYLSHSHQFLREQAERLSEKTSVRHLFSLERICPCLRDDEYKNDVIGKLVEFKFTHGYVCAVCKLIGAYPQRDCPYKQQFKRIKSVPVVVAPIEYVFTKLLDDYKPQCIAVDDCLLRKRLHPPRQNLELLLHYLQRVGSPEGHTITRLDELFSRDDYYTFMEKLYETHRKIVKAAAEDVKTKPKTKRLDYLITSPKEFNFYRKQAIAHGYRDRFATPALFLLFTYVFESKQKGKFCDMSPI
jgi:hypothetical protein